MIRLTLMFTLMYTFVHEVSAGPIDIHANLSYNGDIVYTQQLHAGDDLSVTLFDNDDEAWEFRLETFVAGNVLHVHFFINLLPPIPIEDTIVTLDAFDWGYTLVTDDVVIGQLTDFFIWPIGLPVDSTVLETATAFQYTQHSSQAIDQAYATTVPRFDVQHRVKPIPEPSTLALFVFGIAIGSVILLQRQRRNRD